MLSRDLCSENVVVYSPSLPQVQQKDSRMGGGVVEGDRRTDERIPEQKFKTLGVKEWGTDLPKR